MSEVAQLEREKRRALSKNNLREVANLCNLLGQELQRIGDHKGALDQHREEGALCEALGDVVGKAVSHRRMGEVYCDMGKWKLALNHQNKHLSLAKEAGSLVEEQRAHATIGRTHLQQSEDAGSQAEKEKALNEAQEGFKRALVTCQSLKGEVGTSEHCQMRCRLYLNLGLVLDLRGNSKQARDFINQAIDLCANQNFYDDAHRCHVALGSIMQREGLLPQALQEGQKALALAAKLRDKALLCEGHSFLAQIHLQNSNYEAAKKCLYKAYKLKHPDLGSREQIESNLKTVVNICSAEDMLVTLGENGGDRQIKLYEKLGDRAADLGLYTPAVGYYNKMLEAAVKLNKEPSVLAPAYLSLARTYCDMKQFKQSKEYYHKEYNIRIQEDFGEACKTLLNIAVVSDELGEDIDILNETYKQARDLAIKAKNPKLEAYVLLQHISLSGLSEQVKVQLEAEMRKIIEDNGLDSDIELSEDEDGDNDDDDVVDLDLIHFSDSEEENEDLDRPRQARQKRSLVVKRNEKGETPLHKACIDGNLGMVKKLLQQGHPVNPRDNCGWLPLHEAANHGYCEIVETLLDAGARISDRGGQQCDGVTPLHDAAGAGNFEVVRLLMLQGASVTAKTDDGDTPLECLVKFRLRANLSCADEEECCQLEKELKEKMEQAGHNVPELPTSNSVHVQSHRTETLKPRRSGSGGRKGDAHKIGTEPSTSKRISNGGKSNNSFVSEKKTLSSRNSVDLSGLSDEDIAASPLPDLTREMHLPVGDINQEDNSEELLNPLLEELQHEEKRSATGAYLSAMDCIGSGAHRAELHKASFSGSGVKKNKKVALLSEFEDVGDDWLEDDLGVFTKKRKRPEKFEFEYKEPRKDRSAFFHGSSHSRPLSAFRKVRQTTLTSMLKKYSNAEECDRVPKISESNLSRSGQSSTVTTATAAPGYNSQRNSGVELNSRANGSSYVAVGALRLKVRVQDRLLLVPVAGGGQNHTVGWLAEEVTRRYYQLCGLRPQLTLATQDGAVLDTSDPIALVLPGDQAELVGQVTGWDLPPLPDRYIQACQALGCAPIPFLTSSLHSTEVTTSLDLGNAGYLTCTQLQPVLRAVQYQHSLRSLSLSSCRLGDEGFTHLMETLPSLPALDSLDLTSSSITTVSFLEMTRGITAGKLSLKSLCSLEISYNALPGVKASNIATLFSLPALTTLSLRHCHLNLTSDQQIDAVVTSNLQSLFLDYNSVSGSSLFSLLACLPHLTALTLSGLKPPKTSLAGRNMRLGTALSGLLGGGEECHLQHLDLSYCELVDADLEDISSYLYRCLHLTSVNLANNPSLSPTSLASLLTELTSNLVLPLSSLSLHGNKNLLNGLEEKMISTVQHKANTNHALTSLSFTRIHEDTRLEDIWKLHHKNQALVKRIGSEVLLACTEPKS